MEKLFYEEPYLRVFTARVVSCLPVKRGFEIELDRTAFYPEGGGQPSDTGTLGEAHVLDVQERDGRIVHLTDLALEEGAAVQGEINWEERFSNMQQHSGEHIVSAPAYGVSAVRSPLPSTNCTNGRSYSRPTRLSSSPNAGAM